MQESSAFWELKSRSIGRDCQECYQPEGDRTISEGGAWQVLVEKSKVREKPVREAVARAPRVTAKCWSPGFSRSPARLEHPEIA